MTYTNFRKLRKGPEDLIKTNMVLTDFDGNSSETMGVPNTELTVGSKTVPTMFFIIEAKGSNILLLDRDWIHAKCCIPLTMHQSLVQWVDDQVEIVPVDKSVIVAIVDLSVWEMEGVDCISGKAWDDGFLEASSDGVKPVSNEQPKLTL
ncbi:hypothetical protein GUJ93_ZPchr0012g21272 [Zizania palustris]|uniref:Uncharacterized protein n=1 Tax=Zizania palustris TaxID=103762 RepID=A0A8J5WQN3_ZIZPA|nr:hypothetical protein GUJ93_ZPchr0012g21272 [Zizania palustris]